MDQAVNDFEHSLDSILTDSVDMPELHVSFEEADTMTSSVSSGYLCLVSTHSNNSSLQSAPSINVVNYGARLGNYLYHWWGKCLPPS